MYRFCTLLLLIISAFFSCGKQQKQEKKKQEISFDPPVSINATNPVVTLLDTCQKPLVMVIPAKGSNNYSMPTNDGLKTVTLSSPVLHPLSGGEAGGYSFMQHFNTEQGLALSTVNCGYKDKTGNLWFGTSSGGVSKYDGKSFTNFTSSQGLANNNVKCIIEDKMGNLWFGTNGGGVSKYDGKSFTNFTTAQGLVNNTVLSIIEDKGGNLWFGTDGGLSKYNSVLKNMAGGKSFTNFTTAQGLAHNSVLSVAEDKTGNIWFGTNVGGLSKYDPSTEPVLSPSTPLRTGSVEGLRTGSKSFTNFTTAQGLISNTVTSIIEDKFGNIWCGTNAGVSKYNPTIKEGQGEKSPPDGRAGFTNFNHTQGLLYDYVSNIIEDRSGNLWFGTGNGVSKYDPNVKDGKGAKLFTNYTTAQGLANNQISCITEDKRGSLWFANSSGGGLSKYDGKSFTSFTMDQGLVYNKVWGITEDKKGNLWFVTASGISIYDRGSRLTSEIGYLGGFANFRLAFITLNVRCVIEDTKGNIWFGSAFGVTKYDGKSFTNYTTAQGLTHNSVLTIAEDKIGNLWFGTYGGGISKYDGNRVEALERGEYFAKENQQDLKKINGKFVTSFTNFTTKQGLAGNTVKCIIEDKLGNMWFGTNGNGISKYACPDKDGHSTFTNYSRAQGLPNNTIYSMMEDKIGTLWFGTAGGGVCKYTPSAKESIGSKLFTTYTSAQGLANDVVYAIVEDTLNNTIWFGTNEGLSGLKLNSLSSGAEGVKFENFNNKTGYPIKDVNTGALFLDKKGVLWAGTSDKLVRFDYSGIHKSAEPPAVFIQAVKIQGSAITWYNLKSEKLNGTEMNEADSLAILNEEIITNGQPLTDVQRDALRKKFGDIKFDSITRFYPVPENLVLPFKHNNITFDFLAIETARPFMVNYQYLLEGYDNDWSPVTDKTTATFGNIYEGTYTFKLKAQSPDGVWSEPIIYTFKVLPPWYRTWWMYLTYLLTLFSVIGLFFRWRTASLRKEKEMLEHTVKERTAEVVVQKELIEEKQKEILDSINYAKRIQYTLLANDEMLQQNLKDFFVLFQPKDIVSGDFYWATSVVGSGESEVKSDYSGVNSKALKGLENSPLSVLPIPGSQRFYLAICDSTGHGVPGAFMSLLNISFLNEAITEKNIKQPNEILDHVRQRLIESVSQDGAQDGMDGILLCFENGKITYAAANNAPVIVRENAIINLPTDKMPIGKGQKEFPFALNTIDIQKGDVLYFYTDGYADQFGGPSGKKFKYRQLDELLISIHNKPMDEQKQILSTTIENWKGNLEQVDDILIIGMRI